MRRNNIFRTARRFYFDYFLISAHSFIRDRKLCKTVSWAEEVYLTLTSQIYFSELCDYMTNLIRNIGAFPNAIRNVTVCFLWKMSHISTLNVNHRVRKKVSGQNDNITVAIVAFLLICACAEFISKYTLTRKYVNKNF